MPCAAHDDDLGVTGTACRTDRSTHVGLALQLASRGNESLPGGCHRLGDGVEGGCAVATMFDHVLPPAFGIGVAGGSGEFAHRIGRRGFRHQGGGIVARCGQGDREREVDGVDLDVVLGWPRRSPAIRG